MYDLAALSANAPVARALHLKDELDGMRPLDPEQVGKAMQRLRLEWTYHSNAIEGNTLTYGETRALLLHGVTAQGKPLKDHLDIKGHREALDYLERFVKAKEPLSTTAIREMHRVLLGEPYEMRAETPAEAPTMRVITPGQYKTQPNHVVTATGETHYYARPEETPALMQDLVDWAREAWPQIEGSPQAALPFASDLHHRFAAIHPFDDGNGRMARLLMNLVLMRAGFPPAVLRQQNRPAYYGALAQADAGDLGPLVQFIADELTETLELYLRTLRGEPDPDAFSRRVALLKRQVETTGGSEKRTPEAVARIAQDFISPFIRRVDEGFQEIAPLFNHLGGPSQYVGPGGAESSPGDHLAEDLPRTEWRSFRRIRRLEGFRADPTQQVLLIVEGSVGDDHIALSTSNTQGVLARLRYDEPVSPEEAIALANEVLERVADQIERLHQQAQGQ
ncbi:MAG: Fic family protein [Bacteroidota bacterium]